MESSSNSENEIEPTGPNNETSEIIRMYNVLKQKTPSSPPRSPVSSKSPKRIPYTPTIEAKCKELSEGLAKYKQYIKNNESRLPQFSSSEEAENELHRLVHRLKHLPSQAPKPPLHPKIETKMAQISKQHQSLIDEEKNIQQYRSKTALTRKQEDKEYALILKQIKDAKAQLKELKQQYRETESVNSVARQAVDAAAAELKIRQDKIDQLRKEEKRLNLLEQQSREEIDSISKEENKINQEEAIITQLTNKFNDNTKELNQLKKALKEKQDLIKAKKESIQRIFIETENLESKLDEVVEKAGDYTLKEESKLEEDEILDSEEDESEIIVSPPKQRLVVPFKNSKRNSKATFTKSQNQKSKVDIPESSSDDDDLIQDLLHSSSTRQTPITTNDSQIIKMATNAINMKLNDVSKMKADISKFTDNYSDGL